MNIILTYTLYKHFDVGRWIWKWISFRKNDAKVKNYCFIPNTGINENGLYSVHSVCVNNTIILFILFICNKTAAFLIAS
jgi:hypothetical protein